MHKKMLDYFPGCVCQLALRLPHRDKGQKNETSRKACIAMFLSTEAEIEDHRISKMPLGRCNDAWSDYGDRSQLGKSLKGEHQKRNTAPPKKETSKSMTSASSAKCHVGCSGTSNACLSTCWQSVSHARRCVEASVDSPL